MARELTISKLRRETQKAICKCRIAQTLADNSDDRSEAWYQMGKRHGLANVEGALRYKMPSYLEL